jgi:hypothetical protein
MRADISITHPIDKADHTCPFHVSLPCCKAYVDLFETHQIRVDIITTTTTNSPIHQSINQSINTNSSIYQSPTTRQFQLLICFI